MKFCPNCGSALTGADKFCGECGAPLVEANIGKDTVDAKGQELDTPQVSSAEEHDASVGRNSAIPPVFVPTARNGQQEITTRKNSPSKKAITAGVLILVVVAVGCLAAWLLSSGAPSYDKICRMNDDLKQARQLGVSTQEKCAERLGAAILKTTDETVLANLLANVSFEERFANAILGKIQSPEMLETVARTFKAELIADCADNPFSESLYDAVLDRLPDDSAVERIALARLAEMGGASDARTGARGKKSSGKSELAACLCRRILAMDDAERAEALLEKMGDSDILSELPFETRLGIALRSKSEKVRNAAGVDREYLELGDLVAKWDPNCLSRSVREIIARGREIKNAQEYIEVVKRFDPDFRSNDIDTWVEYAKSVTPVLEAIDRLSANSKSDSSDSFRRSRLVEKRDKAKKEHDEWQKVANDLRAGQSNPDPATFIAACQFVGVYFDPDDIGDTGTRLGTKLRRLLNESESELKEAESELAAFDRAVSSQRDSMNGQIAKLKSQLEQIRQRYETPEARKTREKREAAERKAREEREAAERKAREEREAAERKAHEEREAAERKAREEREAAERKAREERESAERKAREERKAAERKAREEREAAERKAKEKARQAALAWKGESKSVPISDSIAIKFRSVPGNLWFGQYEITQAQWDAVMGKNPSRFKGANNPVERVSWDDCQAFLKKLNALPDVKKSGLIFRLPTAAEWEAACRAGSTDYYCLLANGTEIMTSSLGQVAWFEDNADGKTHPVGQKQPNTFGLYDMHGNVWEWTSTAHGWNRVSRGGGWNSSAKGCESSYRIMSLPSFQSDYLGFRLCADDKSK